MSRAKRQPAKLPIITLPPGVVMPDLAEVYTLPSDAVAIVVKIADNVSYPTPGQLIRLRQSIEAAFGDKPHPPVLIAAPGFDIDVVIDPRKEKPCPSN